MDERRALGRACFAHLGRCALEMACLRQFDDRNIEAYVEWPAESLAVLERALARKKGVLVVTGHVGHWELLARRIALAGFQAHTIAKEYEQSVAHGLHRRPARLGRFEDNLARPAQRGKDLLRIFKQGGALGLLINQDTKVQSVFVPFFGHEARRRAAADLAFRTGAAVVLGFCHRVGPVSSSHVRRGSARAG